jgi:hypothetical protein
LFKFKFYNNILGTNNRISHFNRDVDAACTFCSLVGPRSVPEESFRHIFFDCPAVNSIILGLEKKYFRGKIITMEKFFLSNFGDNEKDNIACSILLDGFRYLIWQKKLEKVVPNINIISAELESLMVSVGGASTKIFNILNDCSFFQRGNRDGRHGDGQDP